MTKEFTAKQLNNNPAPVFAAAYKDGKAIITNNNYTGLGVRFVLVVDEKEDKPCSTD